jgi:O-antigen/teichoic acid export membrane protein
VKDANSGPAFNRPGGLTGQTLSGLSWTFVGMGGQLALQILTIAILARLVTPEEYGVMGMALVITGLSQIFSTLGLAPAVVQKPDLIAPEISAARVVSVMLGAICGAIVFILAPSLEAVTGIPRLADVLRVLSCVFVIEGLSAVAEALIQRRLEFRTLAKINFAAYALGYCPLSILVAYFGSGIWGLVAGTVGSSAVRMSLLLRAEKSPFTLRWQMSHILPLANFGTRISIGNMAGYAAGQGDNFIVGSLLGATQLGFYGRAYKLMALPASIFGQAVDKVVFPAIASIQLDRDRIKVAFRRGIVATCCVVLPASVVIWIVAPEMVQILLGSRWTGVVPALRILAVGMFFRVGIKLGDIVARGTGNADAILKCKAAYGLAVLVLALIGARYGIEGVAVGVTVSLGFAYALFSLVGQRVTGLRWLEFAIAHGAGLLLAGGVAIGSGSFAYALRSAHVTVFVRLLLTACSAVIIVLGLLSLMRGKLGADVGWWIRKTDFVGKVMNLKSTPESRS